MHILTAFMQCLLYTYMHVVYRLVKLMTGYGSNLESVVADLFYILCKENRKYQP